MYSGLVCVYVDSPQAYTFDGAQLFQSMDFIISQNDLYTQFFDECTGALFYGFYGYAQPSACLMNDYAKVNFTSPVLCP